MRLRPVPGFPGLPGGSLLPRLLFALRHRGARTLLVIPWYVFVVRIERDTGRPLIPLTVLVGRHCAPRRLPGLTVHARAWHAVGYGRRSDGCSLSSLGIGLQAIQPWPYRAGLAVPHPGRLRMATASLTCYFPIGLSPPGESGDPRTSLRVHPGCVGDTTKRLTAHTGRASFPASGSPVIIPCGSRRTPSTVRRSGRVAGGSFTPRLPQIPA